MGGYRTQTSGRSLQEENVYIDEISAHIHRVFGPMPHAFCYVGHWEIDLGRVTGRVRPAFLEAAVMILLRLLYQLDDEENALPRSFTLPSNPDVLFLRVGLGELDVSVWGSQETATQIVLAEGLSIELHDLIGPAYSKKLALRIPQVLFRSLAATQPAEDAHPLVSCTASTNVSDAMLTNVYRMMHLYGPRWPMQTLA